MHDHNHRHPRWPHFDPRGPAHYYDDTPSRSEGIPEFNDRRAEPIYRQEDPDIYENEFADERRGESADPWPEDKYYVHRRFMDSEAAPRDDYKPARPQRSRFLWFQRHRRTRPPRPFPVDRHREPYGHDIHAYNGNRNGETRDWRG